MKVPAIRAQMGIWVYYVSVLTFNQVDKYVKKVDDELHKSELLKEMLQRSITENYKSIADYILQQEERFFNSLVLAVYDGDPKWHEVRLEYSDDEEFYDLGILELFGNEKIFPVDGQHRVEGIKKAISDDVSLGNEKIPVIFIGHKKDDDGMQKARRMFSTLNRYAKPVSLRDIIALDEDDSVAIACRDLIDGNAFFANNRILDSKNKAISDRNKEFTTIITLYECNRELLKTYIKEKDICSREGKKITGVNKLAEYIRFRPSEQDIFEFNKLSNDFWLLMSETFEDLKEYKEQETSDSSIFRNKQGGSLFFRPTALLAIVKTAIFLKETLECSFEQVFIKIKKLPLKLDHSLWRNVLWNPAKKTMITTNGKTVELLLLYCVDKKLLTDKEIKRLLIDLQGLLQVGEDEVYDYLYKHQLKH